MYKYHFGTNFTYFNTTLCSPSCSDINTDICQRLGVKSMGAAIFIVSHD